MCSRTDCVFPFDTDSFDTFVELDPGSRKAPTRKRKSSQRDTGNGAKFSKSQAVPSPLSLTNGVSGSAISTDIEPLLSGKQPTLQARPGTMAAFPSLLRHPSSSSATTATLWEGEGTKQGDTSSSQDSSCVVSPSAVQTSNNLSPLLSCLTLPPNSPEDSSTSYENMISPTTDITRAKSEIPDGKATLLATSDPIPRVVDDDISLTMNTMPPLDLSSLDIFVDSECIFPPEEAAELFSKYQNTLILESSSSAPTAVDSASSSINSSGITTAVTSPNLFDLSLPLMDLEHLELPTTLDDLFTTSHTSADPVTQLLTEFASPCSTS
ncbi:hypothetical protein IWQ61_003653 [Dispira simplex]|nr:hypothetical protein IWQ61_003653 [Dispira simplex]